MQGRTKKTKTNLVPNSDTAAAAAPRPSSLATENCQNEPNPISGHPASPPSGRATLIRRAGRVLAGAGYTQDNIAALLGPANAGRPEPDLRDQWFWRTRNLDRLSTLVRLFAMGEPVDTDAAARAFAPLTRDQLSTLGLIAPEGRRIRPWVQLLAESNLVLASDLHPRRGAPPVGHVLGVTRSAIALNRLLVPADGGTALDLATGMGMIAFHMAPGASAVTATDIAPRALAFGRFNAALNDIRNVRFRLSDGFRQLRGATYDRIAGNLPFVISPRSEFVYRDAGAEGDDFFGSILQSCPTHINEGGFAQFMAQWIETGGRAEDRMRERLDGSGCDAWVMRFSRQKPDEYATEWLLPSAQVGPRERARRFSDWLRNYDRAGIEAIHTGLWTLRRRTTRAGNWFLVSDHTLPPQPWGNRIRDGFAAMTRWFKAEARGRLQMLRVQVNPGVILREESPWDSDAEPALSLIVPDGFTAPVSLEIADSAWLAAVDGRRTLAQVWAQVAGAGVEPPQPWLDRVRDMLISGYLDLR